MQALLNVLEALADADKAISLSNKNMRALMRRGIALFELGQPEEAMKSLIEAKNVDSKHTLILHAVKTLIDKTKLVYAAHDFESMMYRPHMIQTRVTL